MAELGNGESSLGAGALPKETAILKTMKRNGRLSQETLEPLLQRFVDHGDSEAIQRFVELTRPRLLAAARRIGAPQDAPDSVQTAYYSLLRKRTAELGAPIFPWLLTAVVRISYQCKANEKRQRKIARNLATMSETPRPDVVLSERERARLVRMEMAQLPGKYRDILVLYYLQGLSTPEIGAILGIPTATAKTRLQRARSLMRPRLAPRLAWCFALLPWFLADCASAATARIGAVVSSGWTGKAAMIGALAMSTGAVVIGIHLATAATRPVERSHRTTREDAPLVRASEDPSDTEPSRGGATTAEKATKTATTSADGRVVRLGNELGVPTNVIKIAVEAEAALARADRAPLKRHADKAKAAVARLAQCDPNHGYRAVVALLRSGEAGPWMVELFEATWQTGHGAEETLVQASSDPSLPRLCRERAFEALGVSDTQRVREYLVASLPMLVTQGEFLQATRALARLGEPRGAPALEAKLSSKKWAPIHPHLLVALGKMGGPVAIRILINYIRAPDSNSMLYAFAALRELDPASARREAAALLASDRADNLSAPALKLVQSIARD